MIGDVIIHVNHNEYILIKRSQDLTHTKTDRHLSTGIHNHTFENVNESLQEGLDTVFGSNVLTVSYSPRILTISIQAETDSEVKLFTDG